MVVYPGAVLGPGDTTPSGQFIKDYVHGHMPGAAFGQSTMTWVHVRDVAEAIVRASEKENNLGEKYLLGKYSLTFQEYVALLSEISGSPPPRWIPDSITMAMVRLSQWVADLTGKLPAQPPLWMVSERYAPGSFLTGVRLKGNWESPTRRCV